MPSGEFIGKGKLKYEFKKNEEQKTGNVVIPKQKLDKFLQDHDDLYKANQRLKRYVETDKNKSQREVSTNEEVDAELTDDIKNNETDDEDDRQKIADAINNLDPYKFELFCRALVNRMHVEMSDKIGVKKSNDGGLDGYGYITTDDFRTTRVAIQAKHWNGSLVQAPEIDKFRGAMDSYRAEYGIFITTSGFTRGAIKKARTGTRVITLIDGDRLVDLVIKYQLHVKKVVKVSYELDDFLSSNE